MSVFHARNRRRAALVAVVAAAAIGGGFAAYGYWTANGTGQGTATTGTSSDFTITASAPVGEPLTPGGPTQEVDFTVQNPSTGTASLSSLNVVVANSDGTTWVSVPGCSAADYTVSNITVPFGEIAGAGEVAGSVTIAMIDSATNQDACQGVTVPLYFTTNALN